MTAQLPSVDPAAPAARVGLPDRWSVATRRLAGAAAVLTVLVSVPLADIKLGASVWVALAGILAVLAFGHVPSVDRQVNRLGNVLGTGLVTLLVIGTGGTTSPFMDMFAIVLVYTAIVATWPRLVIGVMAVGLATAGVGIAAGAGVPYYVDLVADLAVWVTVAGLAGSLSRQLADVARRHRADAALVAAADSPLITTDAVGSVRSWNPAAARLYGITREEALGRHVADLVASPADDPARHTSDVLSRFRYSTRHHHRDGTPIDVDVTTWPVPSDTGGETMGLLVRDITSHRSTDVRLRIEQERFRVFAEQARGVVYRLELTPEPHLSFLSQRMRDLLGLDPKAVQDDPWVVLSRIHPDDGLPFDPRSGTGRFEDGVHEYRVQHADGSWVWVEDHHQPEHDADGHLVASQGILYDVSARKQLEQAREQALADARETARQLERTTLAQNVFLRSVSHQLRTPMTLVRGFASTLRRRGDDLDDDVRALLIARLLDGVDRLDEHLSDLLEMQADDEIAPDRVESVELGALCLDAVASVDTNQHRVAVATIRGEVRGDPRQLARAVRALVRNAVQHTPPETRVTVEMHADHDVVTVRVRDDGPGVDAEILDRVFEPFVQGRAAATSHSPGAGIGLTFVRQVALRHGGSIQCTPLTPGAQFDLVLPLATTRTHTSA